MIRLTEAQTSPPDDAQRRVTDEMRRIVQARFREQAGDALDAKVIFEEVAHSEQLSFVKPIELSRALLDLMDERVVKWDRGFRLVSPDLAAIEK